MVVFNAEKNILELRLGSYNLRMGHLDTDEDNKWSTRKPRLIESIQDNAFDVAGVQEVNSRMQIELREALGSGYTFWFFSPYSQSGVGDKAHGIMFRTSLFEISDKHFFWASEDPDVCSVNDTGSKGSFRRGGCCAVLTHKLSGIRFFLMCTHACYNEEPNVRYAPVYRQMEMRYNLEGLPSFFVGDMNAGPDADASRMFREYWNDAFLSVDACSRKGLENTYNDYEYPAGDERIDYIYYRGKDVEPLSYRCNGSQYAGKYASDHFPIMVDMRIKG